MTTAIGNIAVTERTAGSTLHLWVHGSDEPRDWIGTNLLAFVALGVHLGYLIAAIRLVHHYRHAIEFMGSVEIAGYSLGGATAEVAGLLLRILPQFRNVAIRTHNYGGPAPWWRLARPVFAALERRGRWTNTWIVAGRDPVPYLPPWNRHVGEGLVLGSTGGGPIEDHINGYIAKRASTQ